MYTTCLWKINYRINYTKASMAEKVLYVCHCLIQYWDVL